MSRHASLSILALCLLSTSALAQSKLPSFELQRLQFDPGALGSLVVGTGRTLDQGVLRTSIQFQYEQQPLAFDDRWDPQTAEALVEGKFTAHLTAAYGVLSWLQVGAQLPFILGQSGRRRMNMLPPTGGGLDMPWVGARAGLLSMKNGMPVNLSVDVTAGLPVGSAGALAKENLDLFPRLQVGTQTEWFQVGAEAGYLLRKKLDISSFTGRPQDVVGNEMRLAATVTGVGGKKTRGELSVLVGLPTQGGRTSIEALLAIRRHVRSWLDLWVLGGPGVGTAMDTPAFRVIAGASFSNAKID